MIENIQQAYDRFSDLHGTETPLFSRDELAAWLRENGYVFWDNSTHLEHGEPTERRYVDAEALDAAYEAEMVMDEGEAATDAR